MHPIIDKVKKDAPSHGSIPFWSWNDRLQPEELRRQLQNMKKLGMSGAFMHARTGLETGYLSDEWYDCVRESVDEAQKLGMQAWCYDENGWPSGFGGGELLHDEYNWATFVGLETLDEYPEAPSGERTLKMGVIGKGDPILGVYQIRNGKCVRVEGPSGEGPYYVVRQGFDPSYVDTLNAAVTEKFVEHTYASYKREVGFSESMPGFFTDEPQYYRWATPWSQILPDEFCARYGLDVFEELVALFVDFDGAEIFRYRYYRMLHELFINGFVKVIYDWCEKNGAQLTGHAVEESFLGGQMWCCGGIMPFYEYEHIPGIDYLGRSISNDLAPRQLGSVCAQLGKKKALSEMFACCGWDVSPNELKNIAEMQYAGGVNLMCQHLFPYSERGQRKRDYPAHYSEHLPWQEALGEFNAYFNNLGALLANGRELVDALVVHPIHSAWLWYKRDKDSDSIRELEDGLAGLVELFGQHQIPYHFADEWMMARHGSVNGAKIRVGQCEYSHVVVPCCDSLDENTVQFLREFIQNGGKVWLYGKAPSRVDGIPSDLSWLRSNCGFDDLKELSPAVIRKNRHPIPALRMRVSESEDGKFVYVTSLSHDRIAGTQLFLRGFRGVCEMDLITLETRPVRGRAVRGGLLIDLDFEDSASHVLLESDEQPVDEQPTAKKAVQLGDFLLAEHPENCLTLDTASVRLGGGEWSEPRPIERIRDELLAARFKGDVSLRFCFDAEVVPETLRVCAEPLSYSEVTLNGQKLTLGAPWWLDRSFQTADLRPFTKAGRNELCFTFSYFQNDYVYEVLFGGGSESLRNCLGFDTEVEAVYLYGDFAVSSKPMSSGPRGTLLCEGGFRITAPKETIDLRHITEDGYPFFAGTISAKTTVRYEKGGATLLDLPGRYGVCEVEVNGERAGRLMFARSLDLAPWLREGDNELVLHITNARRNQMGPHHREDPEPYGVGPNTFSFEKEWVNGECPAYQSRYAFMRFGVDA